MPSRVPGAALGHRDTAEGNREASSLGITVCGGQWKRRKTRNEMVSVNKGFEEKHMG